MTALPLIPFLAFGRLSGYVGVWGFTHRGRLLVLLVVLTPIVVFLFFSICFAVSAAGVADLLVNGSKRGSREIDLYQHCCSVIDFFMLTLTFSNNMDFRSLFLTTFRNFWVGACRYFSVIEYEKLWTADRSDLKSDLRISRNGAEGHGISHCTVICVNRDLHSFRGDEGSWHFINT